MEAKQTNTNKNNGGKKEKRSNKQGGVSTTEKTTLKLPLPLPSETIDMKGPTTWSNWIVVDRILVGALPKNAEIVSAILKQDSEIERQGKHYIEIAKRLLTDHHKDYPVSLKQLQFIHLPIRDKSVTSDEKLVALLDDLIKRFIAGEKMFIHCKGGHGRTGVVASCLLAKIYGLSALEALQLCADYHDCRQDIKNKGKGIYSSPETHEQKSQVHRVLSYWCDTTDDTSLENENESKS